MKTFILRDAEQGYFRGLMDEEDVVWTRQQGRALRFTDKGMAELTQVGYCPNTDVVRLVPRKDA